MKEGLVHRTAGCVLIGVTALAALAESASAKIDGATVLNAPYETTEVLSNPGDVFALNGNCAGTDRVLSAGSYANEQGAPGVLAPGSDVLQYSAQPFKFENDPFFQSDLKNASASSLVLGGFSQCLPKAELKQQKFTDRLSVMAPGKSTTDVAKCPKGMASLTGGAGFSDPEGKFNLGGPDLKVTGSAPATNGRGWSAAAKNGSDSRVALRTSALCFPARKMSRVKVKEKSGGVPNNSPGLERRVNCPGSTVPLSGGGFLEGGKTGGTLGYSTSIYDITLGWLTSVNKPDAKHFVAVVSCLKL